MRKRTGPGYQPGPAENGEISKDLTRHVHLNLSELVKAHPDPQEMLDAHPILSYSGVSSEKHVITALVIESLIRSDKKIEHVDLDTGSGKTVGAIAGGMAAEDFYPFCMLFRQHNHNGSAIEDARGIFESNGQDLVIDEIKEREEVCKADPAGHWKELERIPPALRPVYCGRVCPTGLEHRCNYSSQIKDATKMASNMAMTQDLGIILKNHLIGHEYLVIMDEAFDPSMFIDFKFPWSHMVETRAFVKSTEPFMDLVSLGSRIEDALKAFKAILASKNLADLRSSIVKCSGIPPDDMKGAADEIRAACLEKFFGKKEKKRTMKEIKFIANDLRKKLAPIAAIVAIFEAWPVDLLLAIAEDDGEPMIMVINEGLRDLIKGARKVIVLNATANQAKVNAFLGEKLPGKIEDRALKHAITQYPDVGKGMKSFVKEGEVTGNLVYVFEKINEIMHARPKNYKYLITCAEKKVSKYVDDFLEAHDHDFEAVHYAKTRKNPCTKRIVREHFPSMSTSRYLDFDVEFTIGSFCIPDKISARRAKMLGVDAGVFIEDEGASVVQSLRSRKPTKESFVFTNSDLHVKNVKYVYKESTIKKILDKCTKDGAAVVRRVFKSGMVRSSKIDAEILRSLIKKTILFEDRELIGGHMRDVVKIDPSMGLDPSTNIEGSRPIDPARMEIQGEETDGSDLIPEDFSRNQVLEDYECDQPSFVPDDYDPFDHSGHDEDNFYQQDGEMAIVNDHD